MERTYELQLAREEQNRNLALMGLSRPLLGVQVVPLTWKHVVELTLAENAFVSGRVAEPADLFQFLWRLHPCFIRPDGEMPNLRPGQRRPGWLRRTRARLLVRQVAAAVNIEIAERFVAQFLEDAYQDVPASPGGNELVSDLLPRLKWFHYLGFFYFERGHDAAAFLDQGVAASFLLLRTHLVNQGEGGRFMPPSVGLRRLDPSG